MFSLFFVHRFHGLTQIVLFFNLIEPDDPFQVHQHALHIMHICIENKICIAYNAFMLFSIGQQIKTARKERNLSQAQLAKALGMSRTTIGQIEHGTVQEVGVRKLIRVLDYLGLELRVRPAGMPPTLEELRDEGAVR
jgi:DNA-binding XRE family transcriptional regulator